MPCHVIHIDTLDDPRLDAYTKPSYRGGGG